jgi:nucleoside-diphosphate-sugar epimerase
LRLAGLYTLERGAHSFWLNSGKDVSGRADGIINLLHYDDAASACLAALKAGSKVVKGRNFLISDSHPLTRQQICESAMKAKLFQGKKMPQFVGADSDPIGKLYDGTVSARDLQWKPRYESFDSFMTTHSEHQPV